MCAMIEQVGNRSRVGKYICVLRHPDPHGQTMEMHMLTLWRMNRKDIVNMYLQSDWGFVAGPTLEGLPCRQVFWSNKVHRLKHSNMHMHNKVQSQ